MRRGRIRWAAGHDLVAHAHVGRVTLCGAPPVGLLREWPAFSRCAQCTAVAAEKRTEART